MEKAQSKGELEERPGAGRRKEGNRQRKRDSVALMVGEIRFALLEKGEQIGSVGTHRRNRLWGVQGVEGGLQGVGVAREFQERPIPQGSLGNNYSPRKIN